MAKVLDSGLKEGEFDLRSHNYVHFRTNTLGKGMTPPDLHDGLISITGVLKE